MFATNEYFDGRVTSIAFNSEEGPATIGVMAPGEYEFGTSAIEIMRVISGSMDIQLPGSEEWKTYNPGESFTVEKDVTFGVRVAAETSYLCLYK